MVNKKDVVKRLAQREICSISDAEMQVNNVFNTIAELLIDNKSVRITGFGQFEVKRFPDRIGYNPFDKKQMLVKSYKVVGFKMSKDLKRKVNEER